MTFTTSQTIEINNAKYSVVHADGNNLTVVNKKGKIALSKAVYSPDTDSFEMVESFPSVAILPTIDEVLDTVYLEGSEQGETIKITFPGFDGLYETHNDKWQLVGSDAAPLNTTNVKRLMANGAKVEVVKVDSERVYAS